MHFLATMLACTKKHGERERQQPCWAAVQVRHEHARYTPRDPQFWDGVPQVFSVIDGKPGTLLWIYGGPILGPLSDHLGPDCPLVSLNLSEEELATLSAPFRMQAIADLFARQIRDRSPHGPYYVSGWSLAAVLAYETAQRLVQQDCQVDLIVLIDPPSLNYHHSSLAQRIVGRLRREFYHLSKLRQMDFRQTRAYLAGRWEWLRVRLLTRRWEAEYKPEQSTPPNSFEKVLWLAFTTYVPSPFQNRVLIIEARERSADPSGKAAAEWTALATNSKAYSIPGDHMTMFHPPNVESLAATIRNAIGSFCG